MCYSIALAVPARIADPRRYFGPELRLEAADAFPVSAAAIGGRGDSRAFLVTTGMCSCDLLSQRKPHLAEALAAGLDQLLREVPAAALVVHWMSGEVRKERVTAERKVRITTTALRGQWPSWETDVRYVLTRADEGPG